jgi:hypothetical protein
LGEVRREGNKVIVEIDSRIYDYKTVQDAVKNFNYPAKLKKEASFFTVMLKGNNETIGYEFCNFLLDKVKERSVM